MTERVYQESPLQRFSQQTGLQFPDPPSDARAKEIIRMCNYKPALRVGNATRGATAEEIIATGRGFSRASASVLARVIPNTNYEVVEGF